MHAIDPASIVLVTEPVSTLVMIVADEFGRVNVLVVDAGPVKEVNPFPVPPLVAPNVPVIVEVPSATVNPAPVAPAVKVPTVAMSLPTNFEDAIDPASIVLVTEPVSTLVMTLALASGNVKVLVDVVGPGGRIWESEYCGRGILLLMQAR
jgi:energy-converting hydrogenase Eha subunit C